MDAGDAEAEGGELGGLVVHEGDERADDEGGAAVSGRLAGDGGELVAEAFAGAGGHDEEDVLAGGGGFADGLLVGAEGGVAERFLEQLGKIDLRGGGGHACSCFYLRMRGDCERDSGSRA